MAEPNTSTNHSEKSVPPPKGPRLRMLILGLVLLAVGLIVGVWASPRLLTATRSEVDNAVVQVNRALDQKLIDDQEHSQIVAALKHLHPEQKAAFYTCGMHPWVVLPKPGDCPICGMKLIALDPDKFSGKIAIDPVMVQNMGVRIQPVTTGPLVRTIRTVGTIDYDESRVRDINIKVSGWIEKLHVDFVGEAVKAGDPLFEIYSPDLYAAQEEYLLAWRNRDKIGSAVSPDAAQGAKDLLESARTRLQYYDITDKQIEALQKENKPSKTMTIRSPYPGIVIDKHANEGMKVDPGMRIFRIADLSKVWGMVTLYEYQLPFVSLGQKAVITLPYIPGEVFEGRVIYIYPYLDKKTRQVTLRLEFDNANLHLKPGMYANVQLQSELAAKRTLAPRSAVIDTGERQVAFVSLGDGRFEPRNVEIGVETNDGMVEVLSGLKPGEMVVTSGQFLLDSEAKIREALAKMIKGNLASEQQAPAAAAEPSAIKALPDAVTGELSVLLGSYFTIGDKLTADSTDGIAAPARQIAQSVDRLLKTEIPDQPHFWHQHDEVATIRGKALEMIDAKDIAATRLAFADLSVALVTLVKATGVPASFGKPVQYLHCPMFREGQGGSVWLQTGDEVRNPFFGVAMPGCFDQRYTMPPAETK